MKSQFHGSGRSPTPEGSKNDAQETERSEAEDTSEAQIPTVCSINSTVMIHSTIVNEDSTIYLRCKGTDSQPSH